MGAFGRESIDQLEEMALRMGGQTFPDIMLKDPPVKHEVDMPQRRAMLLKLTATFIWHLKRAPAVWRSRKITNCPFNQPSPPYMNAARQRNTSGWVQSIYFYYKNINEFKGKV